ncbi:MAG: T9SS type A sorting domain-containing protein [Flavobacteriales bacterium]|nr:T9SS type A sorting domain-containing protein [Flavobacteriales bacterium]
MKVLFSCAIALFLLGEWTNAQTFQKSLGRTGLDYPMHMIEVVGGGYVISGTMVDDVFLMKMDANGDTLWVKSYSNPKILAGSWVKQTPDGGFVIIGDSHLESNGADQDIILIRTDDEGNELWTKTYSGAGKDYGTAIAVTNDAYFLAGAVGITLNNTEGIIIKTNLDGDLLWQKAIVSAEAENINAVLATPDGGCIAVGTTTSFNSGMQNIFIVRLSADGNTQWTGIYGNEGNSYGFNITSLEDNSGYMISGTTTGAGNGNYDAFLMKINEDNTVAWAKSYGGSDFDTALSTVAMGDQGFISLGQSYSYGVGSDLYLIRTTIDGDISWAKVFGGDGYEFGEGLLAVSDGFILTGGEESFGSNREVYIVKSDLQGNSGCHELNCEPMVYDIVMTLTEEDMVSDYAIVPSNLINTTLPGAALTEHCEVIATNLINPTIQTLFPNPCNNFFTIQGTMNGANLVLYNATGKIVLVSPTKSLSTVVDITELPAGIYLACYTHGDEMQSTRLVKE